MALPETAMTTWSATTNTITQSGRTILPRAESLPKTAPPNIIPKDKNNEEELILPSPSPIDLEMESKTVW